MLSCLGMRKMYRHPPSKVVSGVNLHCSSIEIMRQMKRPAPLRLSSRLASEKSSKSCGSSGLAALAPTVVMSRSTYRSAGRSEISTVWLGEYLTDRSKLFSTGGLRGNPGGRFGL